MSSNSGRSGTGSGAASRPPGARQHELEVFYALVGGPRPQDDAKPNSAAGGEAPSRTASATPAAPVRRPPRPAVGVAIKAAPAGKTTPALAELSPNQTVAIAAPVIAKPSRRGKASWSPRVLCMHLVNRVDRQHMDQWVRRVSGNAMNRLNQAQARLQQNKPKMKS